jgi:hypothetical protein
MSEPREPRPIFVIELQPEKHVVDPTRALRGALKRLLRSYGLRAVSVEEKTDPILKEEHHGKLV